MPQNPTPLNPGGDTYGFVTIAEADTYMETRLHASRDWSSGTDKDGALVTAYRDLLDSDEFDLSLDSGEDTPAAFKIAQYEQALYRLWEDGAIDRRGGLTAQGVTRSELVKEWYAADKLGRVAIAPRACHALASYKKYGKGFKFVSDNSTDEGT